MPEPGLADRIFLMSDSPTTPQHVGSFSTYTVPREAGDGFVHDLATAMREQATYAAPFNYRLRDVRLKSLAPGWEVLEDSEIDIDYHFRHSALPRPGGERQLGVIISRLHSTPLDPARPLWETHLIEGLAPAADGRERFAIYVKAHHAVMDGMGAIRRLHQMVSTDPSSRVVRPLWTIGPDERAKAERPRQSILDRAATVAQDTLSGLRTAAALGATAGSNLVEALNPNPSDVAIPFVAPKSIINGRIGRQRRVATQSYPFDRIDRVAKAAGVKINDVFLAICAGGLRRYLDELGELPTESLIAGNPVSIRVAADDASANAFSVVVMKLFTNVSDPLERLAAIRRSSTIAKDRLKKLPAGAVELSAALFMGPFIVENLVGLGGRVPPPYNVSISNVPGSTEPQYLVGAQLDALYPIGMLYHGIALFIATFMTSGRFGIGFTGDRDALPRLQRLAVYTGEALEELEEALGI